MNLGYTSLMNRLLSWIIICDADALSNVLLHFNSTKCKKVSQNMVLGGKIQTTFNVEVIFFAS